MSGRGGAAVAAPGAGQRGQRPQAKDLLLYLLDRPAETFLVPKGERGVLFQPPHEEFLVQRLRHAAESITARWSGNENLVKVQLGPMASTPDLSLPRQLPRQAHFSLFIPQHRRMAADLVSTLVSQKTLEEFVSTAAFAHDRVNPSLFVYALSVAVLHRPDTMDLRLPALNEVFPGRFLQHGVVARARARAHVLDTPSRTPIEVPQNFTASELYEEHRVAYFREDLGINLHHWHWHLVYPNSGERRIVNKDRRGELFYYMHQQIQARYNFERLCNRLSRVTRLLNLRDPIQEGYFPKLDVTVAGRVWQPRHAGALLKDINREPDQMRFDLEDLDRWRSRILDAIHTGAVVDEAGKRVLLTENEGIDLLGNIIESSVLSINRNLYGDLHNLGHVAIAYVHDPDARFLETYSVMGDPATAMRDPVFYRWHATIDDLFQEHKMSLPRYTVAVLDYPGVKVTKAEIVCKGRDRTNELETFWEKRDIDLSHGIDFSPRGPVLARITHLQHEPFTYKITVENNLNKPVLGTARIFLAPKFDERGLQMLFRDHRLLFIEMDKFQVTLKAKTKDNIIVRSSTSSSISIPFERTFMELESPNIGTTDDGLNYCGCGWPQNMLVPKGTADGFPCQLFVMISNFNDDRVNQSSTQPSKCADAVSFCGLKDKKYPDKRSMGYPFDRMPRDGVTTIDDFLTPNMALTDVKIFFSGRTEEPKNL
ncbi:phenoloxidase 1-like [Ischnura elegans]|uniref:phenoloxidase 1-like n=1 Tax=Ischnura elegans TaxID=197161 RepID=UPI001ED880B5|nr:phenoloxidase 1-like [Ischnura elegans]